jgi:hypothetical protein
MKKFYPKDKTKSLTLSRWISENLNYDETENLSFLLIFQRFVVLYLRNSQVTGAFADKVVLALLFLLMYW